MADNDLLGKIFSAAAGVWAIFLALLVAIFKAWPNIMGRLNERRRNNATEKAEDWHRLRAEIDRKDAHIANQDRVLDEADDTIDELRREKFEWMTRAVTAEATLLGLGKAKQEAAAIVAVERLKTNGNGK